VSYDSQSGVDPLTTPSALEPDPRVDTVYLDVWLEEVDATEDPTLENAVDIGMQTSVRLRPTWRVRVLEGAAVHPSDPGHVHVPLARLTRPRNDAEIRSEMIEDLRRTRLNLGDLEERVRHMEDLIFLPSFADAGGSQFSPMVGVAGTEVVLRGNNFHVGTARVLFGGIEADILAPPEEGEIRTRVPLGAGGAVTIRVETSAGSVTSDDVFTVLAGGGPTEELPAFAAPGSQFAPVSGRADDVIRLSGENFDNPPITVRFATVSGVIVGTPTADRIDVRVPAGMPPGPLAITVTTSVGPITSDDAFEILPPSGNEPAFGSSGGGQFSPMVGSEGTVLTLSGENFDEPGLAVEFISQTVAGPTIAGTVSGTPTPTEIEVPVPAGLPVGSVRIRVTTDAGSVTSSDTFTQLP